MDRIDVSFLSGSERCAAWLYRPDGPGRHACVVLAHGFGGVRHARLDAFAERFSRAGFTALVFDYRHFGDSEGEPRQLVDIPRQLDDWRAAIAFARSLDGVDPERVALWGTSLSGGHVAVLASQDQRIAAAISQAPFMDGVWALRAAGLRNMQRTTVAGLRDERQSLADREPYRIPIVGPPGTLAAMNSPDAEPGYRALFAPGHEFRNEVCARVCLSIGAYRPMRHARRIECPWLVAVCLPDAVTPAKPALVAAARAPLSEVRRYDVGHFDVYVGTMFELAVADQIDFLNFHLPERRASDRLRAKAPATAPATAPAAAA
jgi:pimeloyl-ACP methyl ester carboxylesterase